MVTTATTDWNNSNTGTYTTGGNAGNCDVYYGDPFYWGDHEQYIPRPVYPQQEYPPVKVITKIVEVPAPEPQEKDRKENDMINARQTFLDALMDEGKALTSEEREIVRDAKAEKLELLFARLLARNFESADLAMLKEKPKEVLIKEA